MAIRALVLLLWSSVLGTASLAQEVDADSVRAHIISLERSALERWLVADPSGYLGLYASNVSYFDPNVAMRVDGRAALAALFAPLGNVDLSDTEPRFELVSPTVARHGDIAVLTFNLLSYRKLDGKSDHELVARWNATEVYGQIGREWRIIHSHWSHTQHANPMSE